MSSYEDRYTDDTHGMAEPVSLLPPKPETVLAEAAKPSLQLVHEAAVAEEDELSDEEKEADQTRYECERAAIAFETDRMMKLAVEALSDLSKRRDFPADLSGFDLLLAQCRMLSAHGCTEEARLSLHHMMFPNSHLFWPMRRFAPRYRCGSASNVVSLDAYRTAGTSGPP